MGRMIMMITVPMLFLVSVLFLALRPQPAWKTGPADLWPMPMDSKAAVVSNAPTATPY
jgi:hypothetical protein